VPLRVAWIGGEALLEHAAVNLRTIPTTVDLSLHFICKKEIIFFLKNQFQDMFEDL